MPTKVKIQRPHDAYTEFFQKLSILDEIERAKTWTQVEAILKTKIRRDGIRLFTKPKWRTKFWNSYAQAVRLCGQGVIALPHNFESRDARRRARLLQHELYHHVQMAREQSGVFELKYLGSPQYRAAYEGQAYATGFALDRIALDRKWRDTPSKNQIVAEINRRSGSIRKPYKLHRLDKDHLESMFRKLFERELG